MSKSNTKVALVISNEALIEKSVNEFKVFARKTAESFLEMGRIVYETKQTLRKNKAKKAEFEDFCTRIGFNAKTKTIVKFIQIGKAYSTLKSHAETLPNSWTTLYEVSRIAEEQLVEFINDGKITQFITGADVKKLTGSMKEKEVNEVVSKVEKIEEVPNGTFLGGLQFRCQVVDINDVNVRNSLSAILSLLKANQFKVELGSELEMALNPMREAA